MNRILVVDDSQLIRQIVSRILKAAGFEVIEATDGSKAIEKVETEKPDCMILDILMPEMSGFEVLKDLKHKELEIPVIILSADIQETTKSECFKLGVLDFLNKPPKESELLGSVQKALGFAEKEEPCSPQSSR